MLKSLEFDLRYSSDVQQQRKRQGRDTAVVASLDTKRPTRCQHPVQQELHMEPVSTAMETDMQLVPIQQSESTQQETDSAESVPIPLDASLVGREVMAEFKG